MLATEYSEYDNEYAHTNVYGHALDLLTRNHAPHLRSADSVHLDIGCGFGRIAEPLVDKLSLRYVGIDAQFPGLASLTQRGFETHRLDLRDDSLKDRLDGIIGNRKLASLSLLDTLEHLSNGDDVLSVLSDLAAEHKALVIISVPNIAHRDIGFKLALGRWDYTAAGLLDYTHVRLFNEATLDRVLRHAGLYSIASHHVRASQSDQAFPASHPALAAGTMLNRMLLEMRNKVDDNGDVNQFVHACLAGPRASREVFTVRSIERPFLSVVTRTQGTRIHCLEELGVTLAGQTCSDFEWIIAGHKLNRDRQIAVEQVIEDLPQWLRDKTRLLLVTEGNRARPLNEGFLAASGEYIAIMDDDDVPLGHWVETFRTLAQDSPGSLLRTAPVRQEAITVKIDGVKGIRSTSGFDRCYPSAFRLFDHLRMNRTPIMALAFPRGVFHDLHIKFDESLTTTEDWDFIMRVAGVVGVASSTSITSVYRWWTCEQSSRTDHPQEEWDLNRLRIVHKMDAEMVLFPPGTARQIRALCDENETLQQRVSSCEAARQSEIERFESALRAETEKLDRLQRGLETRARFLEVKDLLSSTSWRVTALFRLARRIGGLRAVSLASCQDMNAEQLDEVKRGILRSRSWRITSPLRAIKMLITGAA